MYYTAPGHRHVQILVPPGSCGRSPSAPTHASPWPGARGPRRDVEPVVAEALAAALGTGRQPSMMAWRFAPAVRAHIRARQRAATLNATQNTTIPKAGKVRVLTCHTREGGEFFGTVQAADGTRRAYAAKIDGGRLVSFKVL